MTRSWWENEEILQRFRDWLTQTGQEITDLDAEVPRQRNREREREVEG